MMTSVNVANDVAEKKLEAERKVVDVAKVERGVVRCNCERFRKWDIASSVLTH